MAEPTVQEEPPEVKEEWKSIPRCGDAYEISSLGRVRSYRWKKIGHLMSQPTPLDCWYDSHGYKTTGIRSEPRGPLQQRRISRLALEAFSGPPPFAGAHARHLDGDKTNNTIANLAWGSAKDNMADSIRLGRQAHGSRCKQSKLREQDISIIRKMAKSGKPQWQIADQFGVSHRAIWGVVNNLTWKHVIEAEDQT